MITLQNQRPIHVKLPRVYRYMHEEYIDQFFEEGVLRISSFEKFRNYPDEIRGDKSEGNGGIIAKSPDEDFQFIIATQVGENGYMLSTSLEESKDLQKKFETDSYFIINDPLNFSVAVSNSLVGIAQTFIGYCNYQPTRIIQKEIPQLSIKDFSDENGIFTLGGPTMAKRTNQLVGNGIDLMFLKEIKHQYQAEFRFIWTINTKFIEMSKEIDIQCKEAVQYCERRSN